MNDDIVQSSERSEAVCKKQPNKKLTTKDFILQANITHNNKYDYSEAEYITAKHKVTIICKIHGKFFQEASYHKNNIGGCPSCGILKRIDKSVSNAKEFIVKAKTIHGETYDYSLVEYSRSRSKVKIICSVHGIFEQTPNNHLRFRGCNLCRFDKTASKAELDLSAFIENLGFQVTNSYRPEWLNGKELDIYIPELNLAIEYNGGAYHHSSLGINKFYNSTCLSQSYHQDKFEKCKIHGIDLIHIFEFENLEHWYTLVEAYCKNKNNYNILFKNNKRNVNFYNKDLVFYGQSYITRIA